ncbi:hypothetical protein AHMF7605_06005 [Adhaeribacter arboris]|uniref:Uncharacterized protein n=1 Tax=Adhaeribacter arboris TaxID=2072846 RepID=A0A2T2YC59_9BACT|nr:hypothetical protein [Adhaeribacter arboris]PSR53111.1 hypothetical protein AHMF7605_06005 [Adhaeribacter arboris]
MRILEERRTMLMTMAAQDRGKGQTRWAEMQQERANEMKVHVDRIREILLSRNAAPHNLNLNNQDNGREAG